MAKDLIKQTGDLVRKCRIKANMTQESLSAQSGYSVIWISKIENGKVKSVKLSVINDLVNACGSTLDVNIQKEQAK